jgi:hypothetical protein
MKRIPITLAALCMLSLQALATNPGTYLLKAVTATGPGSQFPWHRYKLSSFQASVSSGGMATVNVEVTQDPTAGWVVQATFTLGGSNPSFAMATAAPAWPYVRGNVTALSGTNAAATLSMYPP